MYYEFDVTTPANTARESAVETPASLVPGVIHLVRVVFPPGCVGLLHVAILHKTTQVWPTNPDSSFNGNGEAIEFREHFKLAHPPAELTLKTWNDDDTFAHTVRVSFALLEEELAEPLMTLADFLARLDRVLKLMAGEE